jgi:hypothetical protein
MDARIRDTTDDSYSQVYYDDKLFGWHRYDDRYGCVRARKMADRKNLESGCGRRFVVAPWWPDHIALGRHIVFHWNGYNRHAEICGVALRPRARRIDFRLRFWTPTRERVIWVPVERITPP